MSEKSESSFGYDVITKYLPHRSPLLLVDRVEEVVPGVSIIALKMVSSQEPVLQGHFPNQPVLPGVYIIEGLAQASAILMFRSYEERGTAYTNETLLTGVEEARFRKVVQPGSVLRYQVKLRRERGFFAWFEGIAEVDGEVAAEAKFSARVSTL